VGHGSARLVALLIDGPRFMSVVIGEYLGLSGASPYQSLITNHFSRLTSSSVSGANPLRRVFSVTTRGNVKLSK